MKIVFNLDMSDFNPIEILENYAVPRFLLFMLKNPEGIQKVDIRNKMGLSSTISIKVPELCFNEGLITTKPSIDKLLFILTEKGQQIAEYLQKIEELLNQKT